jgi:CBS domain-containing protein
MKVESIMTPDVVCCSRETSLEDVARMMAEHECGVVPVIKDEKTREIVGIITDRDIVCRSLAKGKDPVQMTAADCMTKKVYKCDRDTNVVDCLDTMERHHIRRVPVVDKNKACCGIVTLTNIAGTLPVQTTGNLVKEVTEPLRHNGRA